MTSVFIVYEYFQPLRSDRTYKSVEQVFASRQRAEAWVEKCEKRNKIEGLDGYSYEVEETLFDPSTEVD